ncbi:MAG: 2-hydroxychromene-2-carboxylate isomerase [Pseudomonadota bacterium]
MHAKIDYYFTLTSPWSYFGLDRLRAFADRSGSQIAYKPMALANIYPKTGGLPLPKRSPERQNYRLLELERWRAFLDLPLNLHPAFFPADDTLACRVVVAAVQAGHDVGPLCHSLHRLVWVDDKNIAEPVNIAAVLERKGLPASLLDAADGEAAIAGFDTNTAEALEKGVFGAPGYIIEDELYWGQDRLDFVARRLGLSQ